jgi:hypothetical protein
MNWPNVNPPGSVAGAAFVARETRGHQKVKAVESPVAGPRGVDSGMTLAAADDDRTEPDAPSSWQPVDLTPYLDGTTAPEVPTLLRRADGHSLIYPGRVHWLSGEPEALKTWLALLCCAQVLTDGGEVLYLDFEDSPAGVTARLLGMGVAPHVLLERFHYLNPEAPLRYLARVQLQPLVQRARLVVIDACTEALAVEGRSSKDDTDIASWLAHLPRWAARLGPAVLVLDHVVKDSENRGRWATGSQHKLSGLDGAAFTLEAVQPGGVGMAGRSRLYISKDRHGQVRPRSVPSTGGKHWVADLVVDSTGPFIDVALHAPLQQTGPFLPTAVMTKISDLLAGLGKPLTAQGIETRVGGRAQTVRQAVAALEDGGYLVVTKGPNNSRLHTLSRPYPDDGATIE